jgi:hypothetical protein
MHMRRFTRLTNGFSKKVENHAYAVALHMMYYNFVKVHSKLRMSPAMAAGVSSKLWEIGDIVALVEADEAKADRTRGPYRKKEAYMVFGFFQTLKNAMTGKVINQIDVPIMSGATASLRIKQQKGEKPYVVLACLASGNYQYYPMDLEAFRSFSSAVAITRDKLEAAQISD